ncbi:MAG: hypothetical protein [Malazfec virus 1]
MINYKKIEELEVGKKYKYWELCYIFDENEMRGKSRIVQFNRWRKFFSWHSEGKTKACYFVIDKIHKKVETRYEVDGVLFDSRDEAEKYARS